MAETPKDYYRAAGGHEAINVIEAWNLGFCLGNALKYICRAGLKPGAKATEDLRKAIWYIERYIAAQPPLQEEPQQTPPSGFTDDNGRVD